jgi:hypothetical protein
MSNLTLRDVELTGEYRPIGVGEFGIPGGRVVLEGPTADLYPIVRPISHDGFWAVRQMLTGKMVHNTDNHSETYYYYSGAFVYEQRCGTEAPAEYMQCREFWTRTDWELYEEPAKEIPIRDRVTGATTKAELAEVIEDLWERVTKLEAK